MKAFLAALVAMVAISAGAWVVLDQIGFSSSDRAAGSSVRLD